MCLQNPNATFNDCNEFISNKNEETYFEYEMCVWDFKTETIKTRFLVAKTIFGFILPLIIISISYSIIGIRKLFLNNAQTCFFCLKITILGQFATMERPLLVVFYLTLDSSAWNLRSERLSK